MEAEHWVRPGGWRDQEDQMVWPKRDGTSGH